MDSSTSTYHRKCGHMFFWNTVYINVTCIFVSYIAPFLLRRQLPLIISSLFTARCLSVRPSLCLSVIRRYYVETAKRIVRFFSLLGSHTILVFPRQTMPIFRRHLPLTGVWKNAIFSQYLALSQKWYKIQPWLLWSENRKPHPSFRMVALSMTLNDP